MANNLKQFLVINAQAMINRSKNQSAPAIPMDGDWGNLSRAAFAALSGADQFWIMRSLKDMQKTLKPQNVFLPETRVTKETLAASLAVASMSMPTSDRAWGVKYVDLTVKLESQQNQDGSVTVEYDGKYKGIGQFSVEAWTEVFPNSSFIEEVDNVAMQMLAIYKYAVINRKIISQIPHAVWSPELAYAAHNQGAGKVLSWFRGVPFSLNDSTVQNQSKHAQALLSELFA